MRAPGRVTMSDASLEEGSSRIFPLISIVGLLLVPFALWVEVDRPRESLFALKLPLIDALLWLVALTLSACWIVVPLLRTRRISPDLLLAMKAIPSELWLFVGLSGLTLLSSGKIKEGLPGWIQFVDYYLVLYAVVRLGTRSTVFLSWFKACGILVLLAMILAAGWQIYQGTPPFLTRSLFADHSAYLAAMVIWGPFLFGLVAQSGSKSWMNMSTVVLLGIGCAWLGSFATTLYLVLALGFLCYCAKDARWSRILVLSGTVLLAILSLPSSYRVDLISQPRDWFEAPLEHRRKQVMMAKDVLKPKHAPVHFSVGEYHAFIQSNLLESTRVPYQLPTEMSEEVRMPTVIPEYFASSWSALELIESGPFLGRGLGTWNQHIGTAFGTLERTGTSLPNVINGYLLLGVTVGLGGLLVWVLFVRNSIRNALAWWRASTTPREQSLAQGCFTGLIGATMIMVFCPVATQPLAAYWVILAAVSHEFAVRTNGAGEVAST